MLTLRGLIRYIRLKLRGEEVYFGGGCHQCGNCCRHIFLFTPWGKVISTEEQFVKLKNAHPGCDRFEIIGKENDVLVFKCTWLTEEGTCKDHENRLQLCKNYPAKVMYYSHYQLGEQCGFSLKTGPSFKKVFEQEVRNSERSE